MASFDSFSSRLHECSFVSAGWDLIWAGRARTHIWRVKIPGRVRLSTREGRLPCGSRLLSASGDSLPWLALTNSAGPEGQMRSTLQR